MPFVKLDTGILNSTLWVDRDVRDVFLTALLLAEPREFTEPIHELEPGSMKRTGFVLDPGWYGFVAAAGPGLAHRACIDRQAGARAIAALTSADPESRSEHHNGKRMIRVDGGFVILNYMRYRERDYGSAERMRRWRERRRQAAVGVVDKRHPTEDEQRHTSQGDMDVVSHPRNDTQAEAEADKYKVKSSRVAVATPSAKFEEFWKLWPPGQRKVAKGQCAKIWRDKRLDAEHERIMEHVKSCLGSRDWREGFVPLPATYLNQRRWEGASASESNAATPSSDPFRPSITCEDCKQRVFTWTGHKCDPCYRKYMGITS